MDEYHPWLSHEAMICVVCFNMHDILLTTKTNITVTPILWDGRVKVDITVTILHV